MAATTPAAARPPTVADHQPADAPCAIARDSAATQTAELAAPGRSSRAVDSRLRLPASGPPQSAARPRLPRPEPDMTAATPVSKPTGTLPRNSQRQEACCVTTPPRHGPVAA